MSKLVKWIGGFVLVVVVLLILAAIIVPQVVDPNEHRETIADLVKDKTGRTLDLDGKLNVSVFPWIGIETQGLSLSQPAEIGEEQGPMVSVKQAQLRVKLMPLLSKRVEIDTIVLKQPTVNLITLANGVSSLTGLTDSESEEQVEETTEASGAALALVVQGVDLQQANLLWDDQQAKQRYQVKDLNVQTGNLLGSRLANLSVSGLFVDASQPEAIKFNLDGKAKIDANSLQAEFKNLAAKVTQGTLEADLAIGQLTGAPEKTIAVQNMKLAVSMPKAESESALETLSLSTTIQEITFDQQQQIANVSSLAGQGKYGDRPFEMSLPTVSVNLNQQTAQVPELRLQSSDADIRVEKLTAKQIIDNPSAKGMLTVSPFNVRDLLKELEIDYQASSEDALKAVSLSTNFAGGLDQATLDNLRITLDQTNLTGSVSVKQFDKPQAQFNLALDQLNVDSYLPVTEEGNEETDDEESVSGTEALALPMAVFKDIQANGSFKAKQLIASNLELNDIDVTIASVPGRVTITPKLKLYDGSSSGQIVYSETGEQAALRIMNDVDSVNLGAMLTAADVTDQLSGTGNLALDITVTEQAGKQSNQGKVTLLAKDGAIKGIDIKAILEKAQRAFAQLSGKQEDEQGEATSNDETRFAELSGTFNLQDFVVNNQDFSMKAPLFRVNGKGDIDLAQQALNYLVSVSVVNTSDGQGGASLEKLSGLTIPVRFKGDLTAPKYSLDLKALYKAEAERKVAEKKDAYLKEKLGIEGGGKMSTKDALKGLLNKKVDKKYGTGKASTKGAAPEASTSDSSSDVSATTQNIDSSEETKQQPELTDKERKKQAKDQLKDDLKNKLLDGLFK